MEPATTKTSARLTYAAYAACLGVAITTWFLAIRAPLWLDETGSYWQISGGLSQIWSRQFADLAFPAHAYILWLSSQILGTSEIALRVPSVLAMLAAAYAFYRIGKELFDAEIGMIGVTVFCLNPIVVFEAIDVRPYGFAVFFINLSILLLLRLRSTPSTMLAALFGFASAGIVYFQFLFAVILPVLFIWLVEFSRRSGKNARQPVGVALAAFTLGFLPLLPGLADLFRTARSHVFETSPSVLDLLWTFVPGGLLFLEFALLVAIARAASSADRKTHFAGWQVVFCGSLALVPILTLYGTSVATPIHLFVARHRLVGVPGIALCWAMLLGSFRSRVISVLLCASFVAICGLYYFSSAASDRHEYTWKYALQAAERNAALDNAPVVICSDFPEADYSPMPQNAKESKLFAPLSYYRLTVPVIPLPRTLNAEAMREGSEFLAKAEPRRERFLAMGYTPSADILRWLTRKAAPAYNVHILGVYDRITVLEFQPKRS